MKEFTVHIPWSDLSVRVAFNRQRAEAAPLREYRVASRAETAQLRRELLGRIANGRKSLLQAVQG